MKISNKITNIFNNLTDYELKQILQLMMDQKPEESGLLLLQGNGLINKPVETTNEQPKYKLEWVNVNATDDPARVTNLNTKEVKEYGVEGLPWKLLTDNQDVMHYVFQHFNSDIKIG